MTYSICPSLDEPPDTVVLSHGDIVQLKIPRGDVLAVVDAAVAEWAAGRAAQHIKVALPVSKSRAVHAMPAVIPLYGISSVKWVSIDRARSGSSAIRDTILLSSLETGRLIAVLDAHWITAARTAAMTLTAARHLAIESPRRIGFIGAGQQAMHHLEALIDQYPSIRVAVAVTRSADGAESLIRRARELGLEAVSSREPRDACDGADIIVSSVPASGCARPFLNPRWLGPNSFASLIDLGRAWGRFPSQWGEMYTDDLEQTQALIRSRSISHVGPFEGDLRQLVSEGASPIDGSPRAVLFAGMGIPDAALAALVNSRARKAGGGLQVSLGPP